MTPRLGYLFKLGAVDNDMINLVTRLLNHPKHTTNYSLGGYMMNDLWKSAGLIAKKSYRSLSIEYLKYDPDPILTLLNVMGVIDNVALSNMQSMAHGDAEMVELLKIARFQLWGTFWTQFKKDHFKKPPYEAQKLVRKNIKQESYKRNSCSMG